MARPKIPPHKRKTVILTFRVRENEKEKIRHMIKKLLIGEREKI